MQRSLGVSSFLGAALLVGVALPLGAAASGPSDWIYNPATRHSYALVEGVTWTDAEVLAVRLGGHLATVNDQAENDWLTERFPGPWIYIGLNDAAREGTFVWASGTKVKYTNWRETQPDDWKGFDPLGEDAVVLNSESYGWETISGRWLLSGIVEVAGQPKNLSGNTLPDGFHDGTVDDPGVADACYANGWSFDWDSPARDVQVRILAIRTDITHVPVEVWRGPADDFRQDLVDAGIGDGTAAFHVDLRPLIAYAVPYLILVQGRDVQTGEWTTLGESPRSLTCYPL
jgi:hypothetical protein